MALGQMRQTIFSDTQLSLFQQALNDQFSQISKIPFINGQLVSGVVLVSSGATSVNTGLSRVAQGYFVISNSANSVIWNDDFSSDTSINLYCSLNTTVDIWVF